MTMNILNNMGIGINPAAGVKDATPAGGSGDNGATDFAALLRDAPDDRGRAAPVRDTGGTQRDDHVQQNDAAERNAPVSQEVNSLRERRVTANTDNDPQPRQVSRKDGKKPEQTKNSGRQGAEKADVAEVRKPTDRKVDKATKTSDGDARAETTDAGAADGDATTTQAVDIAMAASTEALAKAENTKERSEIIGIDGKHGKASRAAFETLKAATAKAGDEVPATAVSADAEASKAQASTDADTSEIPDNSDRNGSTSKATRAGEATDLLAKLAQTIKDTANDTTKDTAGDKTSKNSALTPVVANGEGAKVDGDTSLRPTAPVDGREKLAAKSDGDAAARVQGNAATAMANVTGDASSQRENSGQGRGEDRSASDRLAAAMARIGVTEPGVLPLVGQFGLTAADGSAGLTGATGVGNNLSVSLGQQVIDMGVTGQWLDRISQQIASVSNGQGRGSFRLESDAMGPMRVDLTPGTNGLSVRMSVESEAAAVVLTRDSGRLMQDAQLSAVRIAEVRVDHVAHVGEATRSEMGNGQNQGQNASGNGSLANMNQNASQQRGSAAAMAGQDMGRGSSQASPKAEGGRTVSAETGMDENATASGTSGARRARYA